MYRLCVIAVIAFVVCLFSGFIVAVIEGIKVIITSKIESIRSRKEEKRIREIIERRREQLWDIYSHLEQEQS